MTKSIIQIESNSPQYLADKQMLLSKLEAHEKYTITTQTNYNYFSGSESVTESMQVMVYDGPLLPLGSNSTVDLQQTNWYHRLLPTANLSGNVIDTSSRAEIQSVIWELEHPIPAQESISSASFSSKVYASSLIDVPNAAALSSKKLYRATNSMNVVENVGFQRELFVQTDSVPSSVWNLLTTGLNTGAVLRGSDTECFSVWTDPNKIFPTTDGQTSATKLLAFLGGALLTGKSSMGDFITVPVGYFYELTFTEFSTFRI